MKRIGLAILFVVGSAWVAEAQGPGGMMMQDPFAQQVQEKTEIKIFSLENIKSSDAGKLLQQIFKNHPGETISVDERTNSVIANSTPERLKMIEAILLRLDQAQAEEPVTLAAYALKYSKAEEAAKILASVFAIREDENGTRLAVNAASNQVIVYATPAIHEEVKNLLTKLDLQDESATATEGGSILFEIYWIGSDQGESPVPEEIAQVLSKQKKQLGISHPVLLGSASTACYLDGSSRGGMIALRQIKAFGNSNLDCEAMIIPLENKSYKLDLRLSAGQRSPTSIETTIRTQLDHLVFVASTTTGDDDIKPTIFVLKLSNAEIPSTPEATELKAK